MPASIAVVGGGVSGLVAARDLALAGFAVTLFEAGDRLGGRVRSADLLGAPFDVGAEAFATRGGAVAALIEELGLGARVVHPAQLGSWVVAESGALPLPPGGAVGIPARPLSADVRAHVGPLAALRAAAESRLPARRGGSAEATGTLGALVRARLGERVLDRLVRPVALGVYSTDPDELELSAVPGLAAAFAREGSLVRAARSLRDASIAAGGAVAALEGGMATLVAALEAELVALGVSIVLDTPVAGLAQHSSTGTDPHAWTLTDEAGRELRRADAVLLAVAEPVAGTLLGSLLPEDSAGAAGAQPAASAGQSAAIEVIVLAIDAAGKGFALSSATESAGGAARVDAPVDTLGATLNAALNSAPRGTGALVASGAGISAKALTHVTAKWPDRAASIGRGAHVIRLSYGRAGQAPETWGLADGEALALACRDASAILGVRIEQAQVRDWARQEWDVGAPPGSAPRITPLPGVGIAGDWVSGTGLAAVIPGAREAAATLATHLAHLTTHSGHTA